MTRRTFQQEAANVWGLRDKRVTELRATPDRGVSITPDHVGA
ncbi:hypothetical protein [Leptothrix cholodnii]|nr:hypothetical protein [Leptothrix cholodnii]